MQEFLSPGTLRHRLARFRTYLVNGLFNLGFERFDSRMQLVLSDDDEAASLSGDDAADTPGPSIWRHKSCTPADTDLSWYYSAADQLVMWRRAVRRCGLGCLADHSGANDSDSDGGVQVSCQCSLAMDGTITRASSCAGRHHRHFSSSDSDSLRQLLCHGSSLGGGNCLSNRYAPSAAPRSRPSRMRPPRGVAVQEKKSRQRTKCPQRQRSFFKYSPP